MKDINFKRYTTWPRILLFCAVFCIFGTLFVFLMGMGSIVIGLYLGSILACILFCFFYDPYATKTFPELLGQSFILGIIALFLSFLTAGIWDAFSQFMTEPVIGELVLHILQSIFVTPILGVLLGFLFVIGFSAPLTAFVTLWILMTLARFLPKKNL